jgi:hypothetical protein
VLRVGSGTTEQDRQFEELWKRCFTTLGILPPASAMRACKQ